MAFPKQLISKIWCGWVYRQSSWDCLHFRFWPSSSVGLWLVRHLPPHIFWSHRGTPLEWLRFYTQTSSSPFPKALASNHYRIRGFAFDSIFHPEIWLRLSSYFSLTNRPQIPFKSVREALQNATAILFCWGSSSVQYQRWGLACVERCLDCPQVSHLPRHLHYDLRSCALLTSFESRLGWVVFWGSFWGTLQGCCQSWLL